MTPWWTLTRLQWRQSRSMLLWLLCALIGWILLPFDSPEYLLFSFAFVPIWAFATGTAQLRREWESGTILQTLAYPVSGGTLALAITAATLLNLAILFSTVGVGWAVESMLHQGPPLSTVPLMMMGANSLVQTLVYHSAGMAAYVSRRALPRIVQWAGAPFGIIMWLAVTWLLYPNVECLLPVPQMDCISPIAPNRLPLVLALVIGLYTWSAYLLDQHVEA